jgi:hypothetical protein
VTVVSAGESTPGVVKWIRIGNGCTTPCRIPNESSMPTAKIRYGTLAGQVLGPITSSRGVETRTTAVAFVYCAAVAVK